MLTERLLTKRDFTWVDVQEPEQADFDRLSQEFDLPFLLVQDTLRPEHLPKFEEAEGGNFLMMRSFDKDCSLEDTTVQGLTRKIALFISENRVITIHRVELDYLDAVAEKAQKSDQPKTIQGLVHQIILSSIRTYETPVYNIQDLYDEFEQDVLAKKIEKLDTNRIYHFRRQLFVLKRILKQTNDALFRMKDYWEEQPSLLQDLRENIDQLYFQLDEISDNFEHLFELHIALNEQRANEVMKFLTVFSSILLPLNFIASFYGMNFTRLPGLNSYEALYILIAIMIVCTFAAIFYFRKKGWFSTPRD
jgi:magnesium transporter